MQLISDKQLIKDIREMSKDSNRGKSVIMQKLEVDNVSAARKRELNRKISRARAKLIKDNNLKKQTQAFAGKNVILKDYTTNARKLNEALKK